VHRSTVQRYKEKTVLKLVQGIKDTMNQ